MTLTPTQAQAVLGHLDQSCRFMSQALSAGGIQHAAAVRDALTSALELAQALQQPEPQPEKAE